MQMYNTTIVSHVLNVREGNTFELLLRSIKMLDPTLKKEKIMKSWQNPHQCSAAGSRPAGFASGASYEPKTSDPGAPGMVQL